MERPRPASGPPRQCAQPKSDSAFDAMASTSSVFVIRKDAVYGLGTADNDELATGVARARIGPMDCAEAGAIHERHIAEIDDNPLRVGLRNVDERCLQEPARRQIELPLHHDEHRASLAVRLEDEVLHTPTP
jgi:hypothetical protein